MDMTNKLRKFLSDPASYEGHTSAVENRDTPISEVYLTDHWAYKIKKPVLLSYLDYSTLEARHKACLDELRINRPFSSEVYQGLAVITQEGDGRLKFNGGGPAIEYAVKMRRLADIDMMDQRLKMGRFDSESQAKLVQHLALCFQKAVRLECGPKDYVDHLDRLVRANWTGLLQLTLDDPGEAQRWFSLGSRQLLFLRMRESLFAERAQKGSIIEGHGDLRPEHVAIEEQISLIDGVEFNREFRIVDPADELSFLSMECTILGHESLGDDIRQTVLHELQDAAPPELLAFYESYRAMVRAKVNFLKVSFATGDARQEAKESIRGYRDLAEKRLNSIMPPLAFVVTGPMGSGKTSLAHALNRDLGLVHLETDAIRWQLYGAHPERSAYGEGIYTPEARRRVYEQVQVEMLSNLDNGLSVIVDGSFADPDHASVIFDALRMHNHPYLVILCECADAVAEERIRQRQKGASLSQARVELFREQKNRADWSFEGHPLCRLNTLLPMEQQLQTVYRAVGMGFSQRVGSESSTEIRPGGA